MKIKKVNVAGGVIYYEGENNEIKILLIQRAKEDAWPNFYEIPRGKCDNGPNESLINCLKREVKEEVGLDIIPLKYIDKFTYTSEKGSRLSTQYNILCKPKDQNQKIKLSFEHQDWKFITTPGEAELLVLPEMKKTIKKAFEILDSSKTISTNPEYELTEPDVIGEYLRWLY